MAETTGKIRGVVAVELSPAFLKLVEILPGENRVLAVAVEPLESARWGDDAYLRERIQIAVNRHMRSDSADLVGAVPGGHALLRRVEVPEGDDNVADAVLWDMEQYMGRALDEYVMDYHDLGSNASGDGRFYLAAACRRREAERFRSLMESTGLPLAILDVDALAALNAFEANYPALNSRKTLLFKADADMLLCVRSRGGEFLACSAHPLGANAVPGGGTEVSAERFSGAARRMRKLFDEAARDWGEIETVVLCGDLAALEGFREALEAHLPMPFLCLDAFKEIHLAPGSESGVSFMPAAAQCAGALGLALRRRGDC